MRQGEPHGGHLQDPEKCIIQKDNYTLGNTELPRGLGVKAISSNVIIFQKPRHLQLAQKHLKHLTGVSSQAAQLNSKIMIKNNGR